MRSSMPSSGKWLPFYDQAIEGQPTLSHGVSNTAEAITSVKAETILSPTNSSSPANGQLTPKGSPSKSTRKRTRASKKTPATILNANADNFRALVQQFTGCPSRTIFGNQKGPVFLDFGRGTEENDRIIASLIAPSTNNYNYRQQSQSQQQVEYQHLHQQQRLLQEQQSMCANGNTASDVFVSSSSTIPGTNVDIADSFAAEDTISWHQLTMDSFTGVAKGDGFF